MDNIQVTIIFPKTKFLLKDSNRSSACAQYVSDVIYSLSDFREKDSGELMTSLGHCHLL